MAKEKAWTKAAAKEAKRRPGRPRKEPETTESANAEETRSHKRIGIIPKAHRKMNQRVLGDEALVETLDEIPAETLDVDDLNDISLSDLIFVADDLNACLEPDPLIVVDGVAPEELVAAITEVAGLITPEDIIAAKAFEKGTPVQERIDANGGCVCPLRHWKFWKRCKSNYRMCLWE